MKSSDLSHLSLRVLGYISEDGLWAAHCLETDLVGYGKTFKKALNELIEFTEMQVSFAFQTKQPSLLYHPADPRIFDIYNTQFRYILQSLPERRPSLHSLPVRRPSTDEYKVRNMPLPSKPNLKKNSFVQVQAQAI